MKSLIQVLAIVGAVASPVLAQEAPQDPGAALEAMTCRDFIELAPEEQMTAMLAMRAHVNGDPLPDEPLPIGAEAEVGGSDGLGGDSGTPSVAADAATGVASEGVTEVENTAAAAAGEPSPEALTAESLTEPPIDPKLTAMRTSCLGGPDALASDAMRAAHADYE